MQKSFTATLILWKIMRICGIHGAIMFFLCGMAVAHSNSGQIIEKKITLTLNDVPLSEALSQIENISSVKIFYSLDQLEFHGNVSVTARDQSLKIVLNTLLAPHEIRFVIFEKENTIVLKKISKGDDRDEQQMRNDLHWNASNPASKQLVSGTVIDSASLQPIPGVNIIIKGTVAGTETDKDGKYSIIADEHDVLIFSFISYSSYEVSVQGRNVIDVVLHEDVKNLHEVVVNAGYWQVKEKEETGNISRISSKDIASQPVSNPLAAMEGRMPGVFVTQSTGIPGGAFSIQIRGQNSLRNNLTDNGNLPLYVIDGVPYNSQSPTTGIYSSITNYGSPLNSINPNDIESIEVLKDADATSIYGSRGSNGVVLITTKQGKTGKIKVDVNAYSGVASITRMLPLLNTPQYIQMRKEAFSNDNVTPNTTNAKDLLVWDTTRYTNWQKKLIGGNAHTFNAQTSISGGNSFVQFLASGNYYRESTVFPGNFLYQKGSGHFNVNHSSEKFKFSFTSSYVIDNNNLANFDPTTTALTLPPNAPALRNSDGTLNWDALPISNPLANLEQKYLVKTNNLINNLMVSHRLLPGLDLKASIGNNMYDVNELRSSPASAYAPSEGVTQGSSRFITSHTSSWIIEPQLAYKKDLLGGKFQALLGSTFQETVKNLQALAAIGFQDDNSLENIAAASSVTVDAYNYSKYRYNAAFARLNYNLQEKYLINVTARRDGSSRFGPSHRFGNFGAFGAAWILSNEDFFKTISPILSFGKLRTSYGTTGSDQIGDYNYLDSYSYSSKSYLNVKGLDPARLANNNYSWETNRKFEAALDLGFAQDKIMLSTSYYLNRSSNQLVGYNLPSVSGFASVQANLPATVQNSGIEFLLRTVLLTTTNLKWSANLNLTAPTTKLIRYPDIANSPYSDTYQVGKPLSIHKTFVFNGVNPTTGLYQYKDLDGDGIIDYETDRAFTKKVGQSFYGGLQNSISYKRFQFDIFFQFVKQTGFSYLSSYTFPGRYSNQPTAVLNRWREVGNESSVQRYSQKFGAASTAYFNSDDSDLNIVDASYLRLKNLSFSYRLPDALNKKARLENSRIYFQGQNLLTITRYKGLDPENSSAISIPPLRVFTVGIQLTF